MTSPPQSNIENVMVTGATGFVGRYVVRELIAHGYKPICVVRSPQKLQRQHQDVSPDRWTAIAGSLGSRSALQQAADLSQAVVHLVGIIIERKLKGQTFRRVHVRGTQHVVEAADRAGIKRFVHMSALGVHPRATSRYLQTKWQAEQSVCDSRLEWTVFRPSLIHGPEGEFMRLMNRFACGWLPPVMPYFGSGQAKVQPVSVKDVAHCIVGSLTRVGTVSQVFPMGGPEAYSWRGLYNACRTLMPRAKHWKPMISQPVAVAKGLAALSGPPLALAELLVPAVGLFRFDAGQVDMSQQDNICDHTIAEKAFDLRMRDFESELADYADLIH